MKTIKYNLTRGYIPIVICPYLKGTFVGSTYCLYECKYRLTHDDKNMIITCNYENITNKGE
mgnify:CR=1 FL=1